MAVRKIMCACGAGLGSSLMVHVNAAEILKKLGRGDIEVDHTTVNSIEPASADLFIVSDSLGEFASEVPDDRKIVLKSIVDKDELERKLRAYLGI